MGSGLLQTLGLKAGVDALTAKPKLPKAPGTAPGMNDEAIQAAREKERRLRLLEFGRSSTIATSPLGILGSATTASKTLLGE